MVKQTMLFDKNESCSIKKGLVDLEMDGCSTLKKLQRLMESDTKCMNLQNYQNEDHILGGQFKCLEAEVHAIQISLMYRSKLEKNDYGLQSGTCHTLDGSCNTTVGLGNRTVADLEPLTLCSSMETKYVVSLKALVTETVEDSLNAAACDLWEEELLDWQTFVVDFDQYLATQTWEGVEQDVTGQRSSYATRVPHTLKSDKGDGQGKPVENSPDLSTEHRLIINMLCEPDRVSSRGQDALQELIRLSCSELSVQRDVAEACMELWEILVTLCGRKMKTFVEEDLDQDFNVLRQMLYNVIRCLQNLSRKQLLRQLRMTFADYTSREFLEKLKTFCLSDHSLNKQVDTSYYLTLMYWSFRCGCPDALSLITESLEARWSSPASSNLHPDELQCLVLLGTLLMQRLLNHSHHPRVEEDTVWENPCRVSPNEVKTSSHSYPLLDQLLHRLEHKTDLASHPILMLFMSFLHADGTFIGLKTIMPNATAEDFIWYNLTLLEDKPTDRVLKGVYHLQKRIISLGPEYFSSSGKDPKAPLAFAKVACLVMAPTVAIDWVSQAYSELTAISLQWLFYLSQSNIVGPVESHAFLPAVFPDLDKFLGTSSLASGFEELLLPNGKLSTMSISAALQWCELLSPHERITVISSVIHAGTTELLESDEKRSYILGKVEPDGSCLAGLLYRCLLSQRDAQENPHEDDRTEKQMFKGNSISAFETLVAGVAEAAAQCKYYLQAVELSYLISQDRTAMKFLLQLFTSPKIFPYTKRNESTRPHSATQKSAFVFYKIFTEHYKGGDLQDLDSTFELLSYAKAAAECYSLSYEERWKECWERLNQPLLIHPISRSPVNHPSSALHNGEDTGPLCLFPRARLILLWNRTDLTSHLPRLVDVASFCLEHLHLENEKQYARTLLEASQELLNLNFNVSQTTLQRLKKIIQVDMY